MECDDFVSVTSESEGESDIGTEGVPEDVSKKHRESGESVKGECEDENGDHTSALVLVVDPFLWPKVRCLVSLPVFSWPMEPSLSPHLVHVPIGVVPFSSYALSPVLYPECDVDWVVNEAVWQMPEERGCQHG